MAREQRSHLASPLFDDQLISIWIKIIDALREQFVFFEFVFLIPYYQSECNCWHERKKFDLGRHIYFIVVFLTAKS
jgi:hypothetical protein